jgi:hypothetical protein
MKYFRVLLVQAFYKDASAQICQSASNLAMRTRRWAAMRFLQSSAPLRRVMTCRLCASRPSAAAPMARSASS